MFYSEFLNRVKEEVLLMLAPDVEDVVIQETVKNNGVVRDGLVMISQSLNISPTIYLDIYYNQYLRGMPFESILNDISLTYRKNKPEYDFDIEQFKDWERAKFKIVQKLVNYESNKEQLERMPYKRVEDLTITYQFLVNEDLPSGGYGTIKIENEHLEMWGVKLEELEKYASQNTNKLLPFTFVSLHEMLKKITFGAGVPVDDEFPAYYLGNKTQLHGAVHVLNKEIMDEIREVLGDEYYMIPSSVHEVLLLPYDIEYSVRELEEIIRDVNETELDTTEILSDHLYVVDAVNHKLVLAKRYKEYKQELRLREEVQKEKHIDNPNAPKL